MTKTIRMAAFGLALAGAALVQGCASITTGGFVPTRAPNSNNTVFNSSNSRYVKSAGSNAFHSKMTVTHEPDLHDFRYY